MERIHPGRITTRQVGLISVGFLAVYALGLLSFGSESLYLPWLWLAAPLFAIACLPIAVRARTGRPRAGWMLIAAGIACWLVGDAYYALMYELTGESPGAPTVADAFNLLGYALLTVGLVFALQLTAPARNARWLFDAVIVFVAGAGLLYYFVLTPIIESHDGVLATFVGVAYPTWDLVMLAVLIVAAYSAKASIDKPTALLFLAAATVIASDIVHASWAANGSFSYPAYLDLGWLAAYFAFAGAFVAAGEQREHLVSEGMARRLQRVGVMMPYLFLLPVVEIAIFHAVQQGMDVGLVVAAASLLALVLLRQLAAMRENYRLLAELSSENELRERLMEAQSNLGQGIVVLHEGRIQSANGAVQAIMGRGEGDLKSLCWFKTSVTDPPVGCWRSSW